MTKLHKTEADKRSMMRAKKHVSMTLIIGTERMKLDKLHSPKKWSYTSQKLDCYYYRYVNHRQG